MALEISYRQAASMPREAEPADYGVILADWTGRVTRDYGASDAYRVPVAGFIVGDGRMLGRKPPPDDAGVAARGPKESALHNRNAGRTLKPPRGRSSVGRAPPLHGGGRGFESPRLHSEKLLFCRENEKYDRKSRRNRWAIYCNRTATHKS